MGGRWRRLMTVPARSGGRLEDAHQVDHGGDRRDQDEQHDRKRRPGPACPQDLAEAWLAERREPRRELRIVGGEHALHLLEDALLIHRKRHLSPPPPPPRDPVRRDFPYYPLLEDYLPADD